MSADASRVWIDPLLYAKAQAAAFWHEKKLGEFVEWVLDNYIKEAETRRGKKFGAPVVKSGPAHGATKKAANKKSG